MFLREIVIIILVVSLLGGPLYVACAPDKVGRAWRNVVGVLACLGILGSCTGANVIGLLFWGWVAYRCLLRPSQPKVQA